MSKRMPLPPQVLSEAIYEIERGIPEVTRGINDPYDLYAQLIAFLDEQFDKSRDDGNLLQINHRPWYVGIYRVNPGNLDEVITLPWRGPSPACSPINVSRGGVIWTAVKSGKTQYVPDVEELDKQSSGEHVNCSTERPDKEPMRGAEIVIPLFGQPLGTDAGKFNGYRPIVGAWDLDLNVKNIYGTTRIPQEEPIDNNQYVQRLEKILREPGERIFKMIYQGKHGFIPRKESTVYLLPPQRLSA